VVDDNVEKIVEYGATILDSVESRHNDNGEVRNEEASKADSTTNGWQVVNESSIESTQEEGNEAIALAAQLIGSSLFNSGMENSSSREENVLNPTGGSVSSTSSASSVSSTSSPSSASSVSSTSSPSSSSSLSSASVVTNVSPPIVLSDLHLECESNQCRWEFQLKHLAELGFDKDRCVEILERLEAANIGVGAPDEEITVAQVVHELFK